VSALAERLERAALSVDLDSSDLARVLETNPRTVSRWLKKEASPRHDARERLLEVIPVLERLSTTLTAEAAHDWLFTPNPAFDYHKPVDLLRDGDFRRVLGAIDAMAEGVFV
jgi:putative toxin-antitoxin system antitoxin component (TIGR02293 family)